MKILYVGMAVFFFGCVTSPEHFEVGQPTGILIVSLTFTEPRELAQDEDISGYRLYLDHYYDNPIISGVEYSSGKIVDSFGGGVEESAYFLDGLSQINLIPFDYGEEIKRAAAAKKKAGDTFEVVTLDGVKWKGFIKTESGNFTFEDWSPGSDIHNLSSFSDNIHKLKLVLQLINRFYGQSKIGLYSDLCIPEQSLQNCKTYKFR